VEQPQQQSARALQEFAQAQLKTPDLYDRELRTKTFFIAQNALTA
jgi:hypothetical protein